MYLEKQYRCCFPKSTLSQWNKNLKLAFLEIKKTVCTKPKNFRQGTHTVLDAKTYLPKPINPKPIEKFMTQKRQSKYVH